MLNPFRPRVEQTPSLPDPTSQDYADLQAARHVVGPVTVESTWQYHLTCDWSWTAPGAADEHAVCIAHRVRFTLPPVVEQLEAAE